MNSENQHITKVAILDLNDGVENEGMRGIINLVEAFRQAQSGKVDVEIFDVRQKNEVPDISFDIYISSGGPGSPLDSEDSVWEKKFFALMDALQQHNHEHPEQKKFVFLICHSFQIFCRYYGYGEVSKRKSTSFGILPVHKTGEGYFDPLLTKLADPFWAVDSRDYQITSPDLKKIKAGGGALLCIEKFRPHVELERAVMAIRFDDAIVGTQFHPEADVLSIHRYLHREDKKSFIIEKHGEEKYQDMLQHLDDSDKIGLTHASIIPVFLNMAVRAKAKTQKI